MAWCVWPVPDVPQDEKMKMANLIGVISDTHGLMRPEALKALQGAGHILHAGDVGKPGILDSLRSIAPVSVVRGNTDMDGWARALPPTEAVETGGVSIYMIHDLGHLDLSPEEAGFDIVVSGHTHRPTWESKNGVIFLNPGSAGPRRFELPVSIARIRITGGVIHPEIIELEVE